jgi:prepilin-type N-terminal cleavage/methylation domain-containing protein
MSLKEKKEKGFTLLELLIAMGVSFIIMGAVYVIYTTSVSTYRVQDMVISLQDRLRFGLEHLKRDITLASFLSTPKYTTNAAYVSDSRICSVFPNSNIISIYFMQGGDVLEPSVNKYIMPSSVTLSGAFASPSIFMTDRIEDQVVYFQDTAEFPFPKTESEFKLIFLNQIGTGSALKNRYLRIVNNMNREFYYQIVGGAFVNKSVILSQALPATGTGPCQIKGFGVGLEANVVSYIRYSLKTDTTKPGTGKIDLVREELAVDGITVLAGTRMIIAEYVVDLNFFDFVFDTGTRDDPQISTSGQHRFVEDVANGAGGGILGLGDDSVAQNLRFVTAMLSVRTIDEDPSMPFVARTHYHDPLDTYDLNTKLYGSARVMSMASKIELKSLMVRKMK